MAIFLIVRYFTFFLTCLVWKIDIFFQFLDKFTQFYSWPCLHLLQWKKGQTKKYGKMQNSPLCHCRKGHHLITCLSKQRLPLTVAFLPNIYQKAKYLILVSSFFKNADSFLGHVKAQMLYLLTHRYVCYVTMLILTFLFYSFKLSSPLLIGLGTREHLLPDFVWHIRIEAFRQTWMGTCNFQACLVLDIDRLEESQNETSMYVRMV